MGYKVDVWDLIPGKEKKLSAQIPEKHCCPKTSYLIGAVGSVSGVKAAGE
jgi:hypothetical protein